MGRTELTATMQDYLKQIFHLSEGGGAVSTAALAARMSVAAPSVTNMVKRLDEMGLVVHSPYRGIDLTPAGRAVAVEVVRHHRLIELYLAEFLDVPWDQVHDEAERLEHVISEDLEVRIAAKLGQPGFDPHGDPIPSHEGTFPDAPSSPLWDVVSGTCVKVARVSDRDAGLLTYLSQIGLVPGAEVRVLDRSPYAATLTILTPRGREVIGADLARGIRVRPSVAALADEETAR
jgi:DtxR family Mn-dependent transcriptional regulator